MKTVKWLLLPLVCWNLANPLMAQSADDFEFEEEVFNDRDDIEARAFYRYLQEKIEPGAPEAKGVEFGGDVRVRWTRQVKETHGFRTRGSGAVNPVTIPQANIPTIVGEPLGHKASVDRGSVQAHLQADYETPRSWVQTRLEFGDTIGIDNQELKTILQVAWMGYEFYDCPHFAFFMEAGRQPLRNIFTSMIQFNGTFNGILATAESKLCGFGDLYIEGGPSVISFSRDHYAWFGEAGIENIAKSGFYAIYSYAHWQQKQTIAPLRYRYINSQFIIGYHLLPEVLGYDSKIYAGFLINHAAKAIPVSANEKRNTAWYVCLQLGTLKKAGDWYADISYQDVGYQAVPDFDYAGIGRGNYTSRGDLPAVVNPTDPADFKLGTDLEDLDPAIAEGNNNFRGILTRYYYNITSEFTFRVEFAYSVPKDKVVGGDHVNKQADISLIYSF